MHIKTKVGDYGRFDILIQKGIRFHKPSLKLSTVSGFFLSVEGTIQPLLNHVLSKG